MTQPRYIVWSRSPEHCWRIWLPEHFAAAGIAPPGPGDPDLRYAGDDYHAALRAAFDANAEWYPAMSERKPEEPRPPKEPQPEEKRQVVQGMLFGELA